MGETMGLPGKIKDFGWYGAGWAVFKGGTDDPDFYPPIDDIEAQQEWLDGFTAACADYPDGETMEQALSRVLVGRTALLGCLLPGCPWRSH
jgi:hypothetical protein